MQPVWVNLASYMPRSTLDDNGCFWVQGVQVSITAQRIGVICETRGSGVYYYKPENVKPI